MPDPDILTLYMHHRQDLLSYARRLLRDNSHAEDIIQDAYLRFHHVMREEQPENPVAYLYRIVRNLVMDSHRRAQVENGVFVNSTEHEADHYPSSTPSVERQLIAKDSLTVLKAALESLPLQTRIALEMHRFGGYKLREIAAHLEVSPSMAQYLVKEGLKHCLKQLGSDAEIPIES